MIAKFLRENLVGMIVFTLITGVASGLLTEFFKPAQPSTPPPPLPTVPCMKGSVVMPTDTSYHLKFVAVDDSNAIRALIERSSNDFAREIRNAIEAGKIKRVSDPASLTFRISGIRSDKVPSQVAFLSAGDICEGMLQVNRMEGGELRVVAPIAKGPHAGEGSVVLPRGLLELSPELRICIEPTFRLAYPTKTRQNMYCGIALHESAVRGVPSRAFIIVRTM